jgi:ribosomal protein L2
MNPVHPFPTGKNRKKKDHQQVPRLKHMPGYFTAHGSRNQAVSASAKNTVLAVAEFYHLD